MTPFPARPESESVLRTIRQLITCMRLESVAASTESYPLVSLRSVLEAIANTFREKARQYRSKEELRSALRLERRAWALDVFKVHGLDVTQLIRPVDFTVGYSGKILLVKINGEQIPGSGRSVYVPVTTGIMKS